MPSLRTSRKASRNTSPAVRPVSENTPPPEIRSEKKQQQTLPSLWRSEPPLRAPVPSFEDHGLERHGVLEKMAPLGTMPPAKLKITIGSANKKKSGGRVLSSVASPAVATPEVTPPVERRVEQQEPDEQPPVKRPRTEEKETEHAVNGAAMVEDETPLPSPLPAAKIATPLTTQSRRQSSASKSNAKSPLKRPGFTRPNQYHEQVVEAAIEQCKEAGNEKLGAYLQHFYRESYADWELTDVLDNILTQKPSESDLEKFREGLLTGRIAVHKENRDLRAQIRAERDLNRRESVTRRSQKQSPTTPISPRAPSIDKPSTPKLKSPPNPKERRSAAGSTRSLNMGSANHWPDDETNGVGARTRSTRQTRTSTAAAKSVEPAPVSPVIQTPPAQTGRETRSKRRERADSSSSDLSSVDEELVEKGPPGSLGVGSKRNAIEAELDLVDEETAAKRRQFIAELDERRSKFDTPGMSFVRGGSSQTRSGIVLSFNGGRSTRSNAHRRAREESEAMAIDTPQSSPKAQGLGANLRSSRSLGPPDRQNKKRTGARTKISPVKDRSTVAGVPRNSRYVTNQASRQASPSRGDITDDDMSSDDNYDYCVACGEPGRLLCCDGCENAFHFKCCDPPLKSKTPILDEPYFCYSCQADGRGVEAPEQGLFGQLFDKLKSTNVASFQLPKAVQTYYKGVGAKENGEYYDASAPPVPVRGRNNRDWEELGPDGRPKEKTMICRACKQSSLGGKTIIQCDACSSHWHLDCLDPPQANPPKLSTNGKTRAYFRCPLHIENDLRLIGNPQMAFRNPDGTAVRGHKLRQPRNPTIYTPVLQRGHTNNGVIEVELEEDHEEQEDNSVPKLHERAITLDFIEKAKKERLEREYRSKEAAALAKLDPANMMAYMQSYIHSEVNRLVEQQVQLQMAEFNRQQVQAEQDFLNRPVKEQRMALWLTRFAKEHEETNVDAGNLAVLARAVSSLDPVGSVSQVSLNDLRALQGVINNALAAAEKGNVPENADLFDHDVQMGDNDNMELPTSRNLDLNHALPKVTSPSTAAPITQSMRSAASSSPNVSVHVSMSSSATKDMLSETQESSEATTAQKKIAEEEAAASSGSNGSGAQTSDPFSKSISPGFDQTRASFNNEQHANKEETQTTAETEAEAASLHLASPDKYAAAGTSPSAVPSLDQDEEEETYDASESASAAGQSEDSTSFIHNKPLWTRHFVGSERQDDQENKAPATDEESKVKMDVSDEAFGNNLTVPTEKSRGDRSRSYTSVSEVE